MRSQQTLKLCSDIEDHSNVITDILLVFIPIFELLSFYFIFSVMNSFFFICCMFFVILNICLYSF